MKTNEKGHAATVALEEEMEGQGQMERSSFSQLSNSAADSQVAELLRMYAQVGWQLLPVCRPSPAGGCFQHGPDCQHPGKRPVGTGWQPSTDPQQWQTWWKQGCNLAVHTGQSELLVVDLDPKQAALPWELAKQLQQQLDLPESSLQDTPLVCTGGGGAHLYFSSEGVPQGFNTVQKDIPDWGRVELRTGQSIVVVPPSVHPSGKQYEWDLHPWPGLLVPAPTELLRLLPSNSASTSDETVELFRRLLSGELEELAPEDLGLSNNTCRFIRTGEGLDGPSRSEREFAAMRHIVIQCRRSGYDHQQTAETLASLVANPEHRGFVRYKDNDKGLGWLARELARVLDKPGPESKPSAQSKEPEPATDEQTENSENTTSTETNEQAEKASAPRVLSLDEAWTRAKQLGPVRWAVERLIPQAGLTIVAGRPKKGKSTLVRQLAVAVALGKPEVLNREVRQTGVTLSIAEEYLPEAVEHLQELGVNRQNDRLYLVPECPWGCWNSLLTQAHGLGCGLLVLDPGNDALGIGKVIDYADTSQVMTEVRKRARETGIGVVAILHTSKQHHSQPGLDAVLGSTAYTGVADVTILQTKDSSDPESTRRKLEVYGRFRGANAQTLHVGFDGSEYTLLREGDRLNPLARRIEDVLRGAHPDELSTNQLRKKLSRSWKDCHQALGELLSTGVVEMRRKQQGSRSWDTYRYVQDEQGLTA